MDHRKEVGVSIELCFLYLKTLEIPGRVSTLLGLMKGTC